MYKGPQLAARQDLTQHHQEVMDVEHYLQGRFAPLRPVELRPMTKLVKSSVIGVLLHQRVCDARNLAGDSNPCFAF